MKVVIDGYTPCPMDVISRSAGICYGKTNISKKRVRDCFRRGHMSVFEHASVTFRIEGISRACSHQLVRHRLASYCQESQRYCKYDLDSSEWYVVPPKIVDTDGYRNHMQDCAKRYMDAVRDGVNPEDARYMLPESTKTNIIMTMNWREIYHFLYLRTSDRAQWEIRDVAGLMIEACRNNESILPMVDLLDELVYKEC